MTPPFSSEHVPLLDEDLLKEELSVGFHLLRVHRRRQAIWYLFSRDSSDAVSVRELSKEIAAHEQGVSPRNVPNGAYRNVYNGLRDNHLPILDASNALNYEPSENEVGVGPNTQALAMTTALTLPAFQLLLVKEL